MSDICTVGISYRTAPLVLRELIAVSADNVADRLHQLTRRCRLPEAAILSTCNRTEVYCLAESPQAVADWLREVGGGGTVEIYQLKSANAVRHLLRVASGLDSQMLGEPEITGQVKQFAQLARQAGFSGTVINRLMEHALATAKVIRTRTQIGRHSLSYPALAARTAAGIFPDLRALSVLFVGAGDMAFAGLPIFADAGVRRLALAGRDLKKTEKIAAKYNAEAIAISRLAEVLAEFDVVLSATASQVPIIGKGAVESALQRRQRRPMMFADLALPRDLETEIQSLPDVFVYNLDQFGALAAESNEKRLAAASQAEVIIDEYTESFIRWLHERGNISRVQDFRSMAEKIRREETEAALARLAGGVAAEQVINDIASQLTGRLLHEPTRCARRNAACALGSTEAEKLVKFSLTGEQDDTGAKKEAD